MTRCGFLDAGILDASFLVLQWHRVAMAWHGIMASGHGIMASWHGIIHGHRTTGGP